MISAMMTERQKIETSVEERKKTIEQLKENVTRLQLHHTDCSDVAVQTKDGCMIQSHHIDYTVWTDKVRHDCMAH